MNFTINRKPGSSPLAIWDPNKRGAALEKVLRTFWIGDCRRCSIITELLDFLEENELAIIIVVSSGVADRMSQVAKLIWMTRCHRQDRDDERNLGLVRSLYPVLVVPRGRSVSWPNDKLPFSCEVLSSERHVEMLPDYDLSQILSGLLCLEQRGSAPDLEIQVDNRFPLCCDTNCPGRQSLGTIMPAVRLLHALVEVNPTLSEFTNSDIRYEVQTILDLRKKMGQAVSQHISVPLQNILDVNNKLVKDAVKGILGPEERMKARASQEFLHALKHLKARGVSSFKREGIKAEKLLWEILFLGDDTALEMWDNYKRALEEIPNYFGILQGYTEDLEVSQEIIDNFTQLAY